MREKLRLTEQPVTNDSYVQVPDEIFLPTMSDSSHYKSSSTSSILSTNEPFTDPCSTICQTHHISSIEEFLLSNDSNRLLKQKSRVDDHDSYSVKCCEMKDMKTMNKHHKIGELHQNNSCNGAKTIGIKEEDQCDSGFKFTRDVMKEISCPCVQNNGQQHISCVDLRILQDLKMKLYTQERKKRHLQHCIKQQRQSIEKLLQRKNSTLYYNNV